jgi:beta-glucanase (GH16 family)
MFTTWIAGETTNTVTVTLPFDPADGFHDRRIEWSPGEVRFTVDGVVMQEWREGIPRNPMYLMANAWWPAWLTGTAPQAACALVIERIRRGV